jgi:hypothetical protein
VNLVVLFYGWVEHGCSICIPPEGFRYVYWFSFLVNVMFMIIVVGNMMAYHS